MNVSKRPTMRLAWLLYDHIIFVLLFALGMSGRHSHRVGINKAAHARITKQETEDEPRRVYLYCLKRRIRHAVSVRICLNLVFKAYF